MSLTFSLSFLMLITKYKDFILILICLLNCCKYYVEFLSGLQELKWQMLLLQKAQLQN